ncbi:MAG: Nif3-like dinuclear metal center hexameric protein [Oligoflexia bacterium]|nr:Nif3-like dinuclear metal center hexameric protein [Oligoflexia bacterium]
MAQLNSIVAYLDNLLRNSEFQDDSLNGLQVESPRSDIRKVALAVDAGLSVIEDAIAQDANLLIVHHGLLWGKEQPISGIFGRKIELLLRSRCSLYASHLPLDAHPEVGNGFELGRFFGVQELRPFFEYKGSPVGACGRMARPTDLDHFLTKSSEMIGAINPLVLPFGHNTIETVGIVTGSGGMALDACAAQRFDLFISGESKQEVYHKAKEQKINALFAGHYATETFGVAALGRRLAQDFDVETVFIDEPTGI